MNQPPYQPHPVPPPPQRQGASPWAILLIVLGGCGVLSLAAVAILAALLFPVFAHAREAARSTSCRSNMKLLSTAMQMYLQDYDERFPPNRVWQDVIQPYHMSPQVLVCPSARDLASGYAFNAALDRRPLAKILFPDRQPMLFESSLGTSNASDMLQSFAPRHVRSDGKGGQVAFVDGSVQLVPTPPPADPGSGRSLEGQ